jgi:hypothetical protein
MSDLQDIEKELKTQICKTGTVISWFSEGVILAAKPNKDTKKEPEAQYKYFRSLISVDEMEPSLFESINSNEDIKRALFEDLGEIAEDHGANIELKGAPASHLKDLTQAICKVAFSKISTKRKDLPNEDYKEAFCDIISSLSQAIFTAKQSLEIITLQHQKEQIGNQQAAIAANQLQAVTVEKEILDAEVLAQRQAVEQVTQEKDLITQQVAAAKRESVDLLAQINAAERVNADLGGKLERSHEELERAHGVNEQVNDHLDTAKRELFTAKASLATKEAEAAKLSGQYEEIKTAPVEIANLRRKVDELNETISKLKEASEAGFKTSEELQAGVNELTNELQGKTQELEALNNQYQHLDNAYGAGQASIQQLEGDNFALHQVTVDLNQQVVSLTDQVGQHIGNHEDVTKKHASVQSRVYSHDKEDDIVAQYINGFKYIANPAIGISPTTKWPWSTYLGCLYLKLFDEIEISYDYDESALQDIVAKAVGFLKITDFEQRLADKIGELTELEEIEEIEEFETFIKFCNNDGQTYNIPENQKEAFIKILALRSVSLGLIKELLPKLNADIKKQALANKKGLSELSKRLEYLNNNISRTETVIDNINSDNLNAAKLKQIISGVRATEILKSVLYPEGCSTDKDKALHIENTYLGSLQAKKVEITGKVAILTTYFEKDEVKNEALIGNLLYGLSTFTQYKVNYFKAEQFVRNIKELPISDKKILSNLIKEFIYAYKDDCLKQNRIERLTERGVDEKKEQLRQGMKQLLIAKNEEKLVLREGVRQNRLQEAFKKGFKEGRKSDSTYETDPYKYNIFSNLISIDHIRYLLDKEIEQGISEIEQEISEIEQNISEIKQNISLTEEDRDSQLQELQAQKKDRSAQLQELQADRSPEGLLRERGGEDFSSKAIGKKYNVVLNKIQDMSILEEASVSIGDGSSYDEEQEEEGYNFDMKGNHLPGDQKIVSGQRQQGRYGASLVLTSANVGNRQGSDNVTDADEKKITPHIPTVGAAVDGNQQGGNGRN